VGTSKVVCFPVGSYIRITRFSFAQHIIQLPITSHTHTIFLTHTSHTSRSKAMMKLLLSLSIVGLHRRYLSRVNAQKVIPFIDPKDAALATRPVGFQPFTSVSSTSGVTSVMQGTSDTTIKSGTGSINQVRLRPQHPLNQSMQQPQSLQ
jgi:hypothetical protein